MVAAPRDVHIVTSEANAPAVLAGVSVMAVAGEPPCPPAAAWESAAAASADELKSRTSVFALENTHNRTGGSAITPSEMEAVTAVARRHGVAVHLDGSRILQAAVALS